jgi:hypothetical protein
MYSIKRSAFVVEQNKVHELYVRNMCWHANRQIRAHFLHLS